MSVKLYQFGSFSITNYYGGEKLNQKMGYIIVTDGGKIIVIDGGYSDESEEFLKLLRAIGGEKPTISAWFLTHMHGDHIGLFADVIKNHFSEVTIENIYYNFPSRDEIGTYGKGAVIPTYDNFFENSHKFKDVVKIVKKDDVIVIEEVKFEILFVPVNRYHESNNINNSSIVIRMEAEGQSVLFLADLAEPAGTDFIKEVSAEKIKSDIVQMAHHGQYGVKKEVYEVIEPKCCLWCAPDWLWDNDIGGGFNTHVFQTVEVRSWMDELNVKHHIVLKDGTQMLELPVTF